MAMSDAYFACQPMPNQLTGACYKFHENFNQVNGFCVLDFLNPYATIDVSLIDLIRNMGLGLLVAVAWSFVIGKTTRLVVDTRQYLPIFLLLIPSMILIISIIKSSIALSLGLVGALSIVRFRTPIKEPEELLYLFVAIAVGLGLGANQLLATLIGFGAICLGLSPMVFLNKSGARKSNTFVDIFVPNDLGAVDVGKIDQELSGLGLKFDIKRVNAAGERTEILLDVANFDMTNFSTVQTALEALHAGSEVIATENARVIT